MTNQKLQRILEMYPNECEISVNQSDYQTPVNAEIENVKIEFGYNDNFTLPKIIICI